MRRCDREEGAAAFAYWSPMRAIHALVEIAGKCANILHPSFGGSALLRIQEDLIFALDACAIIYGLE